MVLSMYSVCWCTCGRRQLQSGRWSSHWSISRCSPRRASGGPRSGSWEGSPRCVQGSSAIPRTQSSPTRTDMEFSHIAAYFSGILTSTWVQFCWFVHAPHWSAGLYPRPDSALLLSLWQHEVGTDWWSEREIQQWIVVRVLWALWCLLFA